MRDALGMLEQVAVFGGSPVTLEAARRVLGLVRGDALRSFIDAVSQRDASRALEVLEDVAQEGADLRQFLDEVVFYLRGALLIRAGSDTATAADFGQDERSWLRSVAQRWAPADITGILRAYGEADNASLDDRQLLIRLELATVGATGLSEAAELPPHPPVPRLDPGQSAASMTPSTPPDPAPETGVSIQEQERSLASVAVAEPAESEVIAAPLEHQPMAEAQPAAESQPPAAAAPPTLGSQHGTSLAAIEARWPAIVERFQGNVFAKVLLVKLAPAQLEEGRITFAGRLDALDLRRLEEGYRRPLEDMLAEDLGIQLRVRFAASDSAAVASIEDADSVADYATSLFGGRIVPG